MTSKSLYKGFKAGFNSPFSMFADRTIIRPVSIDGSVEKAWQNVGELLQRATVKQGKVVAAKTKSKTRDKPVSKGRKSKNAA